jgi:outer membrane protein assembly factor BamD (BamD/ComL family)
LIHDFIGHDLLPQAYYSVAQSYFGKYAEMRSKTPDLIDLANVNLELFEQAYPTHELCAKSKELYHEMRSLLAWELYEVGHYFQRRKKPKAAALYYKKICQQYPDTSAAQHCHEKHEDLLTSAG